MAINPEAVRLDDYTYSVICEYCRNEFEAQRASARFCGSGCRAKHHRAKRKRQEAINNALDAVNVVIENMPWVGNSQEYVALQRLQTIIQRGMSNVQKG